MKVITSFTVLLSVLILSAASKPETKLVVTIGRHGSRAPISRLIEADWMANLTIYELSPVGKRQHYNLGSAVRQYFRSLFDEGYYEADLVFYAPQCSRMISSAVSHRAGFVDAFESDRLQFDYDDERLMPSWLDVDKKSLDFNSSLPFGYSTQGVRTNLFVEDNLLVPVNAHSCPLVKVMSTQQVDILRKQLDSIDGYHNLYDKLTKHFAIDTSKVTDKYKLLIQISDFVRHDWRNNPEPKLSPKDPLFNITNRIIEVDKTYLYLDDRIRKVAPAALILDILSQLRKSADNEPDRVKYAYYSTHDTMLSPILMSLGVIDARCFYEDLKAGKYSGACGVFPDTAASIVFELLEEKLENGEIEHYSRLYYNLKPVKVCKDVKDSDLCKLDDFRKHMLDIIDQDYIKTCTGKVSPSSPEKPHLNYWRVAGIVLLVIFVIQCITIIYCCMRKPELNKPKFKRKMRKDTEDSEYVQVDDVINKIS
jgi:Histidine phosphatase superfamily (branch 2)